MEWKNRPGELFIENYRFEADSGKASIGSNYRESDMSGFRVIESTLPGHECSTIVTGHIWRSDGSARSSCVRLLSELLRRHIERSGFCPDTGCILFAGIGNAGLASDSLGPKCASRILPTTLDENLISAGAVRIAVIAPGIPAKTGIDTAKQVRVIADHMNAGLIITADSVAAGSGEWLQSVIQITDRGVTPGSATVSSMSGAINAEGMGRPVISIGVPMVIRADMICGDTLEDSSEPMLVTRAEADAISDCYSGIIAGAVNLTVLGK